MELVSVCIPTYNGERYLKACLDCIITQSHWNLEILIVDDQSTDNTVQIAKEYAKFDNRIKVFQNEKNLGLVGNWNGTLKKASGDWIKFCFQDDYLHPDCIQQMIKLAQKEKAGVCITQRNFIIETNTSSNIREYFQSKIIKLEHLVKEFKYISPKEFGGHCHSHLLENILGEPTTLFFKKELLEKYGYYNKDISQMVDYEFVYRIGINEGVCFMPFPFAYFRIHGEAQSDKNRSKERSLEKFVKVEYIDDILLLYVQKEALLSSGVKLPVNPIDNRLAKVFEFFINEQGKDIVREKLKPYFENYTDLLNLTDEAIKKYDEKYPQIDNILAMENVKEESSIQTELSTIDGVPIPENGKILLADNKETISLSGWAYDIEKQDRLIGVYAQIDSEPVGNLLYGQKIGDEIFKKLKIDNKFIAFDARILKKKQTTAIENLKIHYVYEKKGKLKKLSKHYSIVQNEKVQKGKVQNEKAQIGKFSELLN